MADACKEEGSERAGGQVWRDGEETILQGLQDTEDGARVSLLLEHEAEEGGLGNLELLGLRVHRGRGSLRCHPGKDGLAP